VVDGDTLELHCDLSEITLRLEGIDAPETDQPYGAEATVYMRKLVSGKVVRLKKDGEDHYDRTIGDLRLPNGKQLTRGLVRAGAAWEYDRYSDDPRLGELERAARQDNRGLWAAEDPVPPWEWRD
jgi:endonuclease YncB( thermonuclease family)